MDPLTQALLQRVMQSQAPQPQAAPAVQPQPAPPASPLAVPPNPHTKVPSADKRFANAQAMAQAYQGDWTPNPVLLRAELGHK